MNIFRWKQKLSEVVCSTDFFRKNRSQGITQLVTGVSSAAQRLLQNVSRPTGKAKVVGFILMWDKRVYTSWIDIWLPI